MPVSDSKISTEDINAAISDPNYLPADMRGAVKFLVNSGVWDEINGSDSKATFKEIKDYRAKACAIAENGLELSIYIRGGLSLLNELPDSFSELEDWKMIRLHIAEIPNQVMI